VICGWAPQDRRLKFHFVSGFPNLTFPKLATDRVIEIHPVPPLLSPKAAAQELIRHANPHQTLSYSRFFCSPLVTFPIPIGAQRLAKVNLNN
jgi:hypothetical protein